MRCPFCGSTETKVTDSRTTDSGDAIRRRRECLECSQRFTTFERLEETPITVVKKGGEREPFDRSKVMAGLLRASVKRHISREQLEALISDLESDLRNQFKYEITAKRLGEMILDRLRTLDKVAYVRFASVYREFQDIEEFTSELEKLQAPGKKRRKI
jgi:transcriptional repressor NrdR